MATSWRTDGQFDSAFVSNVMIYVALLSWRKSATVHGRATVHPSVHPSIHRRKKSSPARSGRIATIIAVDVPDVFLLAQDRSRAERDGARRARGRGRHREREKERTANAPRMHFQSLYPPQDACRGSAATRRYSSRTEELQKHTGARIECTRVGVLREIRETRRDRERPSQ